jgi:hypothetical protein
MPPQWVFWATTLFGFAAINRGGAQPWLRLRTLGMCCPCVVLTLKPLTHLWLIWFISDSECMIPSALNWVNPAIGTNSHRDLNSRISWLLIPLHGVALGDRVASQWCLLLLEVATSWTSWWRVSIVNPAKKIVQCSREVLCERCCGRPIGDAKSNSSRARREEHQMVWPCQVLELVVSTPCGRVTC